MATILVTFSSEVRIILSHKVSGLTKQQQNNSLINAYLACIPVEIALYMSIV